MSTPRQAGSAGTSGRNPATINKPQTIREYCIAADALTAAATELGKIQISMEPQSKEFAITWLLARAMKLLAEGARNAS